MDYLMEVTADHQFSIFFFFFWNNGSIGQVDHKSVSEDQALALLILWNKQLQIVASICLKALGDINCFLFSLLLWYINVTQPSICEATKEHRVTSRDEFVSPFVSFLESRSSWLMSH